MATTLDEMSARDIDAKSRADASKIPTYIISADGHVDEPANIFDELPQAMREKIKRPNLVRDRRPKGGTDPKIREKDMDLDGIAAEVLYPTFTLGLFSAAPEIQEAAFRVYNDWLADYCKQLPNRLFGVPCLAAYDIDVAIKELQRCHDIGLLGGLIWQVPDPRLPLTSDHYDRLWAAAAEIGTPINIHILTGFNYKHKGPLLGMEKVRGSVNIKTADAVTNIFDLIWSGVFSRHPKLKVEMVESEIGFMPFYLQQWDYYYKRNVKHGGAEDFLIDRLPSEIFNEHFYATFMDDVVGAHALEYWGGKNIMWSSDYPHSNMTWPNSRAFLARQIGDLDPAIQTRVLSQNVIDLYGLKF